MHPKTKRTLVVVGGAGVAYLFLSKSGVIGDSTTGSVSGAGGGLTPGEILENPVETITEVIPKILAPIIKPSTPYVGSKKFYSDVDQGIFGDTEFYNVGSVDAVESARRRAEIAASRIQGTAIAAPWDIAGAGSMSGSGSKKSGGGGSSWGSWGGGSRTASRCSSTSHLSAPPRRDSAGPSPDR